MISKTHLSYVYSIAFVFIFFFGVQSTMEAQLTVQNNTACVIYLKAGQNNACTACNPTGITAILPGGTVTFPPAAICGPQQWLGVKWFTLPMGVFTTGISYNPVLGGACGPDVTGTCNGAFITANWLLGGIFGPAVVILN